MKLKSLVLTSSILALSSFGAFINPAYAASSASAAPTVMVVDYERLVQSSALYAKSAVEFQQKFEARSSALDKDGQELQKLDNELRTLKDALDKDLASGKLTGAQLKKRETEYKDKATTFQNKYAKYQADQQALEKDVKEFQQASLVKIDDAIRKVVEQYAKDNKIDLIISNKAAPYYSKSVDLTDKLIEKVKK